jgi:hypothetical protein
MIKPNQEVIDRVQPLLQRAGNRLATELGIGDIEGLSRKLYDAWWIYSSECDGEQSTEPGSEAKEALRELAVSANTLSKSFINLGELSRRAILATLRDNRNDSSFRLLDFTMLPGGTQRKFGMECGWVHHLNALEKLANLTIKDMNQVSLNSGRKSFRTTLRGAPQDHLAKWCWRIAEAYGCRSESAVLKMVQAILEIEHGKKWMERKKDTKRSPDKGRKAVRKLAQTNPKAGSI